MSGIITYDRQDLISLIKEAQSRSQEELKELSQTDRKTLHVILETFKSNPSTKSAEIEEVKFKSLEARLTGKPSPLRKDFWISIVFKRITGKYLPTAAIRQELEETIASLYNPKDTSNWVIEKSKALQNAADNYINVDLQKLKDNLDNLPDSDRLRKAKAVLEMGILPKLNKGNLQSLGELEIAKRHFDDFIRELEHPQQKQPSPDLANRDLAINPPNAKKVAFNETLHFEPKIAPETQIKPLTGRVKEGDPSITQFVTSLGKIKDQIKAGNVFTGIALFEVVRNGTTYRLPEHSQKLSQIQEKFLNVVKSEIGKLVDSQEITSDTAEMLNRAIDLLSNSDVSKESRIKLKTQLELIPEGQLLQKKVLERRSPIELTMDSAEPPNKSPEIKFAEDFIIVGLDKSEEKTGSRMRNEPISSNPMGEINRGSKKTDAVSEEAKNALELLQQLKEDPNMKLHLKNGKLQLDTGAKFHLRGKFKSKSSGDALVHIAQIANAEAAKGNIKVAKVLMEAITGDWGSNVYKNNKSYREILDVLKSDFQNMETARDYFADSGKWIKENSQAAVKALTKVGIFDPDEKFQSKVERTLITPFDTVRQTYRDFVAKAKAKGLDDIHARAEAKRDIGKEYGEFSEDACKSGVITVLLERGVNIEEFCDYNGIEHGQMDNLDENTKGKIFDALFRSPGLTRMGDALLNLQRVGDWMGNNELGARRFSSQDNDASDRACQEFKAMRLGVISGAALLVQAQIEILQP
jgi:hypothetical protein